MFGGLNVALGLGSAPQHLPPEMSVLALLEDASNDAAGLFLNHFLSMYIKGEAREGGRESGGRERSRASVDACGCPRVRRARVCVCVRACVCVHVCGSCVHCIIHASSGSERKRREEGCFSPTPLPLPLPAEPGGQRVVLVSFVQLQNHYALATRRLVSTRGNQRDGSQTPTRSPSFPSAG